MSLQEITNEVANFGVARVTVTGGEPLAQPNVHPLMRALCDAGNNVSLETSGALDISGVDDRVVRVVDLKTPDSQECDRNMWENIAHLSAQDQIKFVLCSRADYEWAKAKCVEYNLVSTVSDVLFSPSFSELAPTDLANWIVEDRLQVRMQMQLHKQLWGDVPGK